MIIETFGNTYMSDPLSLGATERNFIQAVVDRVRRESNYQSNLIINLTWFWDKDLVFQQQVLAWIAKYNIAGSTKIYFTSFIDLVDDFRNGEFCRKIYDLGHDISFEGFGENWYSLFPCWMQKYNDTDLALNTNPKNVYLSYNRKPADHRVELIQALINQDLHQYGWITFERGFFPEIDNRTGISDEVLHRTQDMIEYCQPTSRPYSRPEDIRTLGDMKVWNDSFCVVVSETSKTDRWHISEKTWKPILGMRPYLLNASPKVTNILSELGFYTPGDLFDNSNLDNGDIKEVVNCVGQLSTYTPNQLYNLWFSQQDKLLHNRRRFEELAIEWNYSASG